MRGLMTLFRVVAVLAWSAVSFGQQDGPSPTPAPPPEAAEEAEAPPAAPPAEVDEEEFIPTEELAPDAAVTFPVDI